MKISLATLLSVRDLLPAEPALATVLGGAYADPEYAPTQSDINAAADLIDKWYGEITPIGQETVLMQEQTPESYMDACRDNDNQVFALLEVTYICGLKMPPYVVRACQLNKMAAFSQHRDEYAHAPSSTGVQADIDDALKEERLRRASIKDVAPAYTAGSKAWDMFHRTKIMFFCIAR